jgi:hypothetical protein
MAGTGRAPDPASGRSAYRKKKGEGAVLSRSVTVDMPPLPDIRDWSDMTEVWWADVWASPMAQEYDESDKHGLMALAMIVDDFWTAETSRQRQEASQEIRLQGVRFGLSPIDRRRLQWEIEKAEDAQARTTKRRRAGEESSSPAPKVTGDPRAVLRAL